MGRYQQLQENLPEAPSQTVILLEVLGPALLIILSAGPWEALCWALS